MQERYKVILHNRNIYKEIDLTPECEEMLVGTSIQADVRLRREWFFGTVDLHFMKKDSTWSVVCSDGLYFSTGNAQKLLWLNLTHGTEVSLKYDGSDNEVFALSFMIDFDYENKDYSCAISLKGKSSLIIGTDQTSDIRISDSYLTKGHLVMKMENNVWTLQDESTIYGVYVNGIKIKKKCSLKDRDFFSIDDSSFYYRDGTLYTDARVQVSKSLHYEIYPDSATHLQYPKFVRNSRIQYVIPEEEIEVLSAEQKPKKPKKNLLMSLIPALLMLALTIVLRGFMGSGGTFVIYSAISMSIGIVTSVITYRNDGKEYTEQCADRIASYQNYIERKTAEIEESRERELSIRRLIYTSLEEELEEVEHFDRRLFERTKKDKDFLQVYMGTGRVLSANQIKYNDQEYIRMQDELDEIPQQLAAKYQFIEDAPVVSDFCASNGIGIVGSREQLKAALKNITIDIAVRHFYGDVKFVYIFGDDSAMDYSWISWLRNVYNDDLDIKNIVCDEESRNAVLEYLYLILSEREQNSQTQDGKEKLPENYYVVFITNTEVISNHPVSRYVEEASKYGFTFVFFEEYEECIPQGCAEIIRLKSQSEENQLVSAENGMAISTFRSSEISDTTAEHLAVKLSSVFVDEVNLEGELTKNITMFDMLGIIAVEDLDLAQRWRDSQVSKSLAAPLGVKSGNQTVYLDISDKAGAHGPHGLVAGTTGSGKSEILQTYILSLATLFHPYEVGFVIIDFKGGGMSNQFTKLPHLIGTITNIDGREIDRSLQSIKAELVKRQEMFSESNVNHINDYINLYKSGAVTKPMPHLIIIVDEFAELKSEYPDFMKELISAARIGRTLGVHLILATQKPSGVVDAQIWSNSKFKLCLKVQTREDSNEVIKTPLAAEIVEAGRAYFQVGNNEVFDLFQSAYSGADVPAADEKEDKIYEIYERNFWGKKNLIYTNKKKKSDGTERISQLEAIVNHVADYCAEENIVRLPGICLPSLPDKIDADKLCYEEMEGNVSISIPIGKFDDPMQQMQGDVTVDFSKENIYIVGSAQMGKTVLLQTMAYGLIRKYSPEQVNLYFVDCGSMVLKIFEDSHHVGGVVISTEDEKCRNLFKMLVTTMAERKRMLSDKGIGNYASYLDAGYTDLPLIVVMIDNMAAFKEYFQDEAEMMGRLSREAQGVGICFVVTAAQTNAMSYRVQANFGRKYILNCNDSSEYSTMFGHCKETPKEVQGRGLMLMDRRVIEWQAAIYGKSDKEEKRTEWVREFMKKRNQESKYVAKKIPMVPEKMILNDVMAENPNLFRKKQTLPIGMTYSDVDYAMVDMKNQSSLALLGGAAYCTAFLNAYLTALTNHIVFHNVEAIVIDDKNRSLAEVQSYGFVKNYTNDPAEALEYLDLFYAQVEEMEDAEAEDDRLILLVFNNADIFRQVCMDKTMSKEFSNALKRLAERNAFAIVSQVPNQAIGFNASDVLKTMKEVRQGVMFAPIQENKFYEVSGRVRQDTNFEKSNAYLFADNTYKKIKVFE